MVICREPDDTVNRESILKESIEILSKVYEVIDNNPNCINLHEVLQKAGVDQDKYTSALKVSKHG